MEHVFARFSLSLLYEGFQWNKPSIKQTNPPIPLWLCKIKIPLYIHNFFQILDLNWKSESLYCKKSSIVQL